jgi:hypothetical protein
MRHLRVSVAALGRDIARTQILAGTFFQKNFEVAPKRLLAITMSAEVCFCCTTTRNFLPFFDEDIEAPLNAAENGIAEDEANENATEAGRLVIGDVETDSTEESKQSSSSTTTVPKPRCS